MAPLSGFFYFSLFYLLHITSAKNCTKDDIKEYSLPCDQKTRMRKVVTFVDNDCTLKDLNLIKNPTSVPCACPPGQGLSKSKCVICSPGSYSVGGEDISDWGSWTKNGTVPPTESGITTYCETHRSFVKPCEHWRASYFNDSLDSGDNSKTKCMSSVLTMRKQFVEPNSYVQFEYRIEGRKCYSSYVGCDGLAFYVDNTEIMTFTGNQFVWKIAKYNVTTGFHQLKWVYRKNCYGLSYRGVSDKAFIRSITLVGTLAPQTTCTPCPAGSFSTKKEAKECIKCSYFQYQPQAGKTSCQSCPSDQYSMLGSAYCIPLINCTKDDLIMAPDKLKTCVLKKDKFYRKMTPIYSSVMVSGSTHKLCLPTAHLEKTRDVPCRCQPGYQLINDKRKAVCKPCEENQHSADGMKCKDCPSGYVTLRGKHYYIWVNDTLPDGITAQCTGDCSVKNGWIPSGDHVRTSRVVGDVLSNINTYVYNVVSNIARINFTCAVVCNISQPNIWVSGNHLADIGQCNLVFRIWASNGTLIDQMNCTNPKGRYVYRHERNRDGKLVKHSYPLKKGSYRFSWTFNQGDELRSTSAAFEGKLYNISIVGIDKGSALDCTPCGAGSYSISGNTDCSLCPKGTYSEQGSSKCKPCPNGTFADAPGSGQCLPCGANTLSLPTRDGCTNNECQFSPAKDVDYDFTELSREDGPMFEVLAYQQRRNPASRRISSSGRGTPGRPGGRTSLRRLSAYSIWPPYRRRYYVNLCTVKHENTTCTFLNTKTGVKESLPVMGCRTSWWSQRDTSIGRVIGFKPKAEDVRSGVMVELLHGDRCYSGRGSQSKYSTTIDLQCDVEAGVGSPGPESNYTQVLRRCNYYFVWRSLYACPKCRKQDFEKVQHQCVDGVANVTISRKVPCWGMVGDLEAGVTNVSCATSITSKLVKVQSTVNKVLIGVGVVVIIALIVIAGYFFYKHRDIRYKYYSALARNKPMSKLEEEEEDYGNVEGDMFHESRNIVRG
ncbi:UPF0577 protein KIAA1324-like [Actinia tenebrosa]|uniref:UPF0577 protein KIAA1324-like n=1 Tax=Actinia tenebrosa TaxID=6105 RepID=A0A6P8HVN7_ACTTE|nr:UPF0577 protein KIAA1324-like [Actinia tenebrosa]